MKRLVLSVVLVLVGCGDDDLPTRQDSGIVRIDGGGGGDGSIRPDTNVGDTGVGGEDCETRARWVYLVDSNRQLIRFEPDSLTFNPVGVLNCDPSSSPFSMAVDRNATAWVLYQNGRIYNASTVDASCSGTTFAPGQAGLDLFGMGFVGRGEDRLGEQLFIAGGPEGSIASGASRLATISMPGLNVNPLGNQLPGWPELTGTADGQLWGFFPDTSPPSASRLNQATGAPEQTFPLTAIRPGQPMAWAFAFWGGRYYVFLQTDNDASTNVYRLDPTTGVSELILPNTGRRIVGAGVSICAPIELI